MALQLLDFDGDGDPDIADLTGRSNSVISQQLYFRSSGQNSTTWGKRNSHGIGAKVTIETDTGLQTRTLTSCQGYASANEPVLHFGLGDNSVIRRLSIRWPLGHLQTFENLPTDKFYRIREPKQVGPVASSDLPKAIFRPSKTIIDFKHEGKMISTTTQPNPFFHIDYQDLDQAWLGVTWIVMVTMMFL